MHHRLGCGATVSNIGESPLMDFLEWYAGIQNGQFLLFDYPEESRELFAAMQALCVEKARLYAERSPADFLLFTENTSTTILSPEQFRLYCMGHLTEYCTVVAQLGRRLLFHMCGHLKALLPDLAALNRAGFEAFTSPPVGDALFSDARAVFQAQCLIGGTNCLTWTKSAAEIIAELEDVIPMLRRYPGLILSTGGIIPPVCSPETVKYVAEWIYSQRI